jgi:hypothetical protein
MPEGCDPVQANHPHYDSFWWEVRGSLKDERARHLLDLVLSYPPSFFLSSYEVADALSIPQPSAWRLLAQFQAWGLLRLVKRGTPLSQLKDGERPKANEYQRLGITEEERAFIHDRLLTS